MRKNESGGFPEANGRQHLPTTVELPPSGIFVFESHHTPDFRMQTGVWSFAKLCWVPVGAGELETGEGRVRLSKDDLVVVPPGLPHRFVDDPAEPFTLVMICIGPEVFEARPAWTALYRELIGRPRPLHPRNGFHRSVLVSHFRQMIREQFGKAPGWEVQLEAHLGQLLVALSRGAQHVGPIADVSDAVMAELLEFLESRFVEAHTIGELAARCGLSPRRFTDRFRRATGCTLVEYLNRKRIAHACERLRETGHVPYACYEAGFQDIAYFYRTFKRYTGTTPGKFGWAPDPDRA